MLFLGDSLTDGWGAPEGPAFPFVLQRRIRDRGLAFLCRADGVPGDTSAGGLRRSRRWLADASQVPAVVVIQFGANDVFQGIAPGQIADNLAAIARAFQHAGATAIVAGTLLPQLGQAGVAGLDSVYRDVERRTGARRIDDLLKGVLDDPLLLQDDGVHPTAAGHRVMAENAWPVLEEVLLALA